MFIPEFKLERTMSLYQHHVKYDLTETGVLPLSAAELISKEEFDKLYSTDFRLRYIQTDGTKELKEAICSFYNKASPENVLVTSGSAEANLILSLMFIEKGDEIAYMLPHYMQIHGLAKAFGAKINPFYLQESQAWHFDTDSLRASVTPKTKFICFCNPNNPTGSILSEKAMDEIVEIASSVGAWIVSDEIYRGAELSGEITSSFWNRYDKVIVTGGLAKAFALPGLRVGWLVAPSKIIAKAWSYHDYTSICITTLSDYIAQRAFQPEMRRKILRRNRCIASENLDYLTKWINERNGMFSFTPTKAGGFAFIKYNHDIPSRDLTMRMMNDKSVFVVPGDCFGVEHFFRISFGIDLNRLKEALNLIAETFEELKAEK